jgi:hypothetical protein
MKASWLLLFQLLLSYYCFAQTSAIKLYGCKQQVSGGVPSTYETDEQGNKVESKNNVRTNFYFFLTHPPQVAIEPIEFWMNGALYKIKLEQAQTPFNIVYDNGPQGTETVTLVPQTADSAFRIILFEQLSPKNSEIKKQLVETNELVFVYKTNGKLSSQTLKRIKGLRTAIMQ